MSYTEKELKKEAMKHIRGQTELYYDVLADMSNNPDIYGTVLEEIMKRLVYTSNKYNDLEVE